MNFGGRGKNSEHISSVLKRGFENLIKNYEPESGARSLDLCGSTLHTSGAPSLAGRENERVDKTSSENY